MRSFGIRFLIILLTLCLALSLFGVSAEEHSVEIGISPTGDAYYGGEMTLRVAILKPKTALAGIEFTLAYDKAFVEPLITENGESGNEMDSLITKSPSGWEQMSYHEEGLYTFRFALPDNGKDLLDESEELVLEIPFAVRSAGSFSFTVASEDVIAIANDKESSLLSGKGNTVTVVAASVAKKLQIDARGNDTANERGAYSLELIATNLGDKSGISAIEFEFTYDKSVFSPTVTTNENGEMDVFMTNMPGEWEQMCSLDAEKGKYTLRFASTTAESETDKSMLASGKTLSVTIPFKVIGKEGDVASFMVGTDSIIGINAINGILSGVGCIRSVSIEKAQSGSIPGELGYTVKDGYLYYINEKTAVPDFLSPFSNAFSVDSEGDFISTGDILTDGLAINLKLIVLGDVNGNGEIEKYDYILVKRQCLNTVTLNEAQEMAADANGKEGVDKYDYILIKRHCLGTFTIKAE